MFLWRAALAAGFGFPIDWTAILLVRRRDDNSSVYRQTFISDPQGALLASETIQSDLDGMTLDSFCEEYGIGYEPRSSEA